MHKHLKTLKKMTKSRRRNKSANTSEIMNYPSTAEDFRRLHPELYNKLYDDDAPMPLDPKTKNRQEDTVARVKRRSETCR